MMSETQIVISVASWEERFFKGMVRLLDAEPCSRVIIFHSDEYSTSTETVRDDVVAICKARDIVHTSGLIHMSAPNQTWNSTFKKTLGTLPEGSKVIVDISTMPREVIWHTLWFLHLRKCSIRYVYNRPVIYGAWLSRDPERPRLVYKMSGITQLGAKTALLVLAGYDVDRVCHLVDTFEPSVTLLGLQSDSIDPQNTKRMEDQRAAIEDYKTVTQFTVDAYSRDHGLKAVSEAVSQYSSTHNIIMASMGPKLSAISLFEMQLRNDALGLVYLPAKEFSMDYSKGIGESIWGSLPLH